MKEKKNNNIFLKSVEFQIIVIYSVAFCAFTPNTNSSTCWQNLLYAPGLFSLPVWLLSHSLVYSKSVLSACSISISSTQFLCAKDKKRETFMPLPHTSLMIHPYYHNSLWSFYYSTIGITPTYVNSFKIHKVFVTLYKMCMLFLKVSSY